MKKDVRAFIIAGILCVSIFSILFWIENLPGGIYERAEAHRLSLINPSEKNVVSPETQELIGLGVEYEVIENYVRSGNTIELGDFVYPITNRSNVRIVMNCSHELGAVESINWDKSAYIAEVSEDNRSIRTDHCTNVIIIFADFSPSDYHKKISITNLSVDGHYSSTENCTGQGIDWFCRETRNYSHSRDNIDFLIISPEEQLLLDKIHNPGKSFDSAALWLVLFLMVQTFCVFFPFGVFFYYRKKYK